MKLSYPSLVVYRRVQRPVEGFRVGDYKDLRGYFAKPLRVVVAKEIVLLYLRAD
jgi:hypothetical protein